MPKKPQAQLNFSEQKNAKSFIYKALYQLNDVVLGLIFLIGSFLFFSETTVFQGTALFVIGSIQMIIRPLIAMILDLHMAALDRHHNDKSTSKSG
ncbi:YrhK family protein [Staphylococcus chromogenes]|uniref:YrhK family protein n=1 Tax=Staphylococcus chromogenes TaxID=46126 RepID=UPI002DBAEE3B|nr:YrhK family protein [Staphylococcus chromogenes]MEB7824604.1 YrhK family protein [Staphylococcus chromogenes]